MAAVGFSPEQVPSESTIRRTVQRLDGDAMDRTIGSWAARHTEPGYADGAPSELRLMTMKVPSCL